MAKFPFTNFFDVNGNSQMDFSEELLAMKVFEDALPGEESAPVMRRKTTAGWLRDGLSDEIDEEDINSLIDQDLGLHSPDFLEEDSEGDAAIWDDLEDDEDVWDDSQEEAEGPVAYLTFSVESREERFAKQGVRREDYPSQRVYDAACDLIDLQNGKGYVPSASTHQREIDRRRFWWRAVRGRPVPDPPRRLLIRPGGEGKLPAAHRSPRRGRAACHLPG